VGIALNGAGLVYATGVGADGSGRGVVVLDALNGSVVAAFANAFAAGVHTMQSSDAATDAQGNVWACSGRVLLKYAPSAVAAGTNQTFLIGPPGADVVDLRGVALDSNGTVWLADYSKGRVFAVSPVNGSVLGNYTGPALASGIAVDDAQSRVYVSSERAQAVVVLDAAQGGLLGNFSLDGIFPRAVALDRNGAVWVTNTTAANGELGRAVVKLDAATGAVLGAFEVDAMPTHILVDGSGRVWVACANASTVAKLSLAGESLGTLYPNCTSPLKLAVDAAAANLYATCNEGVVRMDVAATHTPSKSPSTAAPAVPGLSESETVAGIAVGTITLVALVLACVWFAYLQWKEHKESSAGPVVKYTTDEAVLVEWQGVPYAAKIKSAANPRKLSVAYDDDGSVEHKVPQERVLQRLNRVNLEHEVWKKGETVLCERPAGGVGYAAITLGADNPRKTVDVYYAHDRSTESKVARTRITQRITGIVDHPLMGYAPGHKLVLDVKGKPYLAVVKEFDAKNQFLTVVFPDDKSTENRVKPARVMQRYFVMDLATEQFAVGEAVMVDFKGVIWAAVVTGAHAHAMWGTTLSVVYIDDASVESTVARTRVTQRLRSAGAFDATPFMGGHHAPPPHNNDDDDNEALVVVAAAADDGVHAPVHHAAATHEHAAAATAVVVAVGATVAPEEEAPPFAPGDLVVVDCSGVLYVATIRAGDLGKETVDVTYPDDGTAEDDVPFERIRCSVERSAVAPEELLPYEMVIVEHEGRMWAALVTQVDGHALSVRYTDDDSDEDNVDIARVVMKVPPKS